MVKLFMIKCQRDEHIGYVGNLTVLKHEGFNVRYTNPEDLHSIDSGVVLFFSHGQATVICNKIRDIANERKPGHEASIDVVSDLFDQEFADKLMNRSIMFKEAEDE